MPIFNFSFTVDAPLAEVAAFHYDTSALKKLNPPFMFVQLHQVDPMGEGSISEFTMWFGPIPIRWRAVHSQVSQRGFTDSMVSGPARSWVHTHTFTPLEDGRTRVDEHIEYEYKSGPSGWLGRLLFARPNLTILFAYRAWATRRAIRRQIEDRSRA